jgi:hypothetical protein
MKIALLVELRDEPYLKVYEEHFQKIGWETELFQSIEKIPCNNFDVIVCYGNGKCWVRDLNVFKKHLPPVIYITYSRLPELKCTTLFLLNSTTKNLVETIVKLTKKK